MRSSFKSSLCALAVLGGAAVAGGCISTESKVLDTGEGCDEFVARQPVPENIQVDASVKAFMQASSDFTGAALELRDEVFTACVNIATDLGLDDTWSQLERDDAISNSSGTGACDRVITKARELIDAGATVGAHVAVSLSRGLCHYDFDKQVECDQSCSVNQQCSPGTVETRCEPGSLSVQCSAECSAGALCEGKPDLPANCMGQCEAECQGECKGQCISADGKKTDNDPNCRGKCSAACNGTCKGLCKVEAPVSCGAGVHCTGGCTAEGTNPVCVSEFKPPECQVDETCHEVCSARVEIDAKCEPPLLQIYAAVDVSPELVPLKVSLEKNLPPLVEAAEAKGKIMLHATERVAGAGESLSNRIGDLDGHSLACLGASSTEMAKAVGSLQISVDASAKIEANLEVSTVD